jgi:hypothetical protein
MCHICVQRINFIQLSASICSVLPYVVTDCSLVREAVAEQLDDNYRLFLYQLLRLSYIRYDRGKKTLREIACK